MDFEDLSDVHSAGTPSGLSTTSTGVPSSEERHVFDRQHLGDNTLVAVTVASLSPTLILRFWRRKRARGGSHLVAARHLHRDRDTNPDDDTLLTVRNLQREVSRTSRDFTEDCAKQARSSGVSSVSPQGVTFPTRMSPVTTSAPMRMIRARRGQRRTSSETFGISRVISSGPSFVSRASTSCSSMWIDDGTSS